ncbi:MAG: hypothetical protein J7L82_01810, partial [Staphylothermus sp.]|nr:hypothetical protein [Staphylothermus sp.]
NNAKTLKVDAKDILPLIAVRDGQSKSPSDYKKGDKFRIHTVKIKVKEKQGQNSKIEKIKYNVLINDYYSVVLKPENQGVRVETYLLPITNVYFEILDHDVIPDIIVTNLDTFNRMLSTPRFNIIWKNPESLGCIVFDEAHVYDKTNLLHLIYILKRTRSLIKELTYRLLKSDTVNQPLMVFSSATLHKEFENIIKNVLGEGKAVYRITHEGSKDPQCSKLELVTIIAPRPNVAGQWIAQLIGLYNVALSLSKAIKSGAIYNNAPIPYKAILFVDSLHYLRSIKRFISDILIKRLGNILKEHNLETTKDPNDRDHWSFIDNETVRFVQEYLDSIKRDLVRAHWADLQQEIREKIEEDFNEKTFPTLLVSTSTLELGIDIPDIWSIIQFRPPLRSDSFIQRIGRAGRSDKTYRTALGTLVLTNQPTDIAYLIDDNKSNELFHILPPKMPKNSVVTKQHILLSIADFLNIKSITSELNETERAVVNTLFYEPGDGEPNIEQAAKIYAKLIMKYRNEIANYIENVSEDFKELRYGVIDKILADLAKIYRPSGIKEALVKSVNIKEIAKEAKKTKEQVNKINDLKSKILNILSNMVRKMPTNNQVLECFNTFRDLLIEKLSFSDLNKILDYLSMLEVIVITGKAEDLEEIYEEKVDDIESYSRIIGDIIDVMNETDCKIDLSEMKSSLIELRHRLIELANKIRNCNELRDYVESTQRLSQYIGVTNTLLSLLGMYTRDGMYYTSLMTQPVKQVEVNYVSGTRTEPVFLALSRIASLTVDKLVEGEQLD